jgi:hypothetical protein
MQSFAEYAIMPAISEMTPPPSAGNPAVKSRPQNWTYLSPVRVLVYDRPFRAGQLRKSQDMEDGAGAE